MIDAPAACLNLFCHSVLGSHDCAARLAVSQECHAVSAHDMLCKVVVIRNLGYISLLLAAQVLLHNLFNCDSNNRSAVCCTILRLHSAPLAACPLQVVHTLLY